MQTDIYMTELQDNEGIKKIFATLKMMIMHILHILCLRLREKKIINFNKFKLDRSILNYAHDPGIYANHNADVRVCSSV